MAQMRDRREGVERVVPLGRGGGVGDGRAVDVEAHVLGQDAAAEDVAQQPLVAGAGQDGVMPRIGPHPARSLGPEIPDEQAHRQLGAVELAPAVHRLRRPLGQETGVGMGRIGIGHDDIGPDLARRPPRRTPAARPASSVRIRSTSTFWRTSPPIRSIAPGHGGGHRAHAAHRVVHALLGLQMADQGVDRRHPRRIPADEEGMEGQRHAQPVVLHPRLGQRQDGPVRAQPGEAGQRLHRRPQAVHRLQSGGHRSPPRSGPSNPPGTAASRAGRRATGARPPPPCPRAWRGPRSGTRRAR